MKILEPESILEKFKKIFDKSDLLILILTFCFGLVNNFYFIIGDGVAPDAVSPAFFNIAGNWEISLGRFAIKYVNLFRYGLVSKLIIILISLFLIAFSVMILKRIFNIKSNLLLTLLTCFICVAPQFTETYMFIYCADAYLVAFFLSTLGVYFLNKTDRNKLFYIPAIICTSIVCALYQAYLGVIVGLTIILVIKYVIDCMDIEYIIKKFVFFMLAILIGIILYYIVLQIILSVLGLSLASYKGANSLGIDTIKNIPKSIVQCYKDFYHFFFTNDIINNAYWKRKKLYLVLYIIMFISGIIILIKEKLQEKKIRFFMLIFLISIFPIGISIMNLIATGTKINLVTGPGLITFWLIIILIYNYLPKKNFSNLLKWGLVITSIILIWTFLLQNIFTYIAREQTYINYRTISSDIYSRVVELENYSVDKKWMFSDVIRFTVRDLERSNGFITHDNVTWNNYNGLLQNANYYEKYLGIKIKICSKDEYYKIIKTEEFKKMPVYPISGSVRIIDDIIVIKTSEKTY